MMTKGIFLVVSAVLSLTSAEDITFQASNVAKNLRRSDGVEAADVSHTKYVDVLSRIMCPAGYYREGKKDCSECPSGHWSPAGSKRCSPCPAGQFTNDHLSCTDCPAGEYSKCSSSECKQCGKGKVSKAGASACTLCIAGHYADHDCNECMPCIAGTASNPLSDTCKSCSVGQYSPPQSPQCMDCLPSYYSIDPTQPCKKCPIDQYSAAKASKCLSCPSKKTVNSSQTGCVRKPTYKPTLQPTFAPTPDAWPPLGYYCNPGYGNLGSYPANPQPCVKCLPGLYSPGGGWQCAYCSEGYAPNADQSACVLLETPSEQPTSEPTYKPTYIPGQEPGPFDCGPGSYPNTLTQTCWPCPFGLQSPGDYAECQGCPIMYRANEARTGCEEAGPLICRAGYYGKGGQGTWRYPCDKCPPGEYRSDGMISMYCRTCMEGYVVNADQSACVLLETPSRQPTSKPTFPPTPDAWPPLGYYCDPGYGDNGSYPVNPQPCVQCLPDMYSPGGHSQCEFCSDGYTPNADQSACVFLEIP